MKLVAQEAAHQKGSFHWGLHPFSSLPLAPASGAFRRALRAASRRRVGEQDPCLALPAREKGDEQERQRRVAWAAGTRCPSFGQMERAGLNSGPAPRARGRYHGRQRRTPRRSSRARRRHPPRRRHGRALRRGRFLGGDASDSPVRSYLSGKTLRKASRAQRPDWAVVRTPAPITGFMLNPLRAPRGGPCFAPHVHPTIEVRPRGRW